MSKEDKEQLSQAKSDFANLASHQLRTPLSGTKWLLELLEKSDAGNLTTKQKDMIEKIYDSNERMIALVNDLLEVSQIENGHAKLYLQPTDIGQITRDLIKDKEKAIKDKHLEISLTIEQEPFPRVKTELNKIKQAINNLLSNSIAFTLEGGKITVTLKKDGPNTALFSIQDSGVGIPKEQQKHIFDRFFRGSNIRTLETTGTGLGLYIARAFIESSGGKIWFKSEMGKGTTFFFTLPIA